ncbi:pH-response regulator protein-like protein palA/RIM20 [Myriangium duriaei CBS 260.36]|uniref:PH-response regulator protein-like protein palA/RIM20 n=1 Tax=Myriangium duriaei CBS 260.36 TaxID=1168546 RepID=A0A9P4IXS7_9PEZI|nr:pH-response regulator protein-like protein palA/RIM20 [Myriangium duriaei CBS 260.36]
MTTNILPLPFRRTQNVSLKDAIKKYISTKYDQHPQMFANDLDMIDQLRHDAINALEPHASGVPKLQAYAAQLVWMGSKFPIDLGVEFVWYPSLGYNTHRPVSQDNLRFDLVNILFNLAAMYSQLALSSNRSTADGLKVACNNFSLAAGVISHIKTVCMPDMRTTPPEDMDNMTLESVEHLMLAQAQECFWQKAVKDGLKDASIAKLAAKVSDFYSQAGDWGVKSDAISSEWIHHMNAKHHHFAAAAQYRAACDCLDKRRYGEEVARLRDSLGCVTEALKEARYINKAVLADLNGLKTRVQEDLKRAEKDNDMIYLLPVPSKSELKVLDRATMVTAKTPPEVADALGALGESGSLGRPLFVKLVPYSVHVAASIYTDRQDSLVNEKVVHKLEALTTSIHESMQSLGLPGSLQALEKPLGLPPGLAMHAQEIRQQNGIQRLHRVMTDTEKLKTNDCAIYQEGVDLLRSEHAEDEQSRRKFGTDRWRRPPSNDAVPQLYQKVSEIEGYLNQAANSDKKLQHQLKTSESLIRLLSGTDRDLEDFVPSSRRATMTAKVEREVNNLRCILNELGRLESRRKKTIERVRAKAKADDVHNQLLEEASRLEREHPMQTLEAVQFEEFFDRRLEMYNSDRDDVKAEEREQESLLNNLRQANDAFIRARGADSSTKERESALQQLENAYLTYNEIMSNLETGRSFYNDLAAVVTRFRDDCRAFVYQRRTESTQLEGDLSTALAQMSLQNQNSNILRQQKQQEGIGSRNDTTRPSIAEPMAAPTPTRASAAPPAVTASDVSTKTPAHGMWQPGMPIRFGGPAK